MWKGYTMDRASGEDFKVFLRTGGFYYEASSCYADIHFEIRIDNPSSLEKVTRWLEKYFEEDLS